MKTSTHWFPTGRLPRKCSSLSNRQTGRAAPLTCCAAQYENNRTNEALHVLWLEFAPESAGVVPRSVATSDVFLSFSHHDMALAKRLFGLGNGWFYRLDRWAPCTWHTELAGRHRNGDRELSVYGCGYDAASQEVEMGTD